MLTLVFNVQVSCVSGTYDVNQGSTDDQMRVEAIDNMTLAQVMHSIQEGINWEKAVYAGVVFNKRTKADLEALIDNYISSEDWRSILRWTAICRKLGIERESAIKAALEGLPMVGPLPWTSVYGGANYFCVEDKYALFGYYYAEKYGYQLDKWNKTAAYNFFKTAIYSVGRPVLFVSASGDTWTISYGPRYYDEAACTLQCFLIFYELGVAGALNDALYWWNWINNNLWYQDTHYKYALGWADYECEAGFFAKIATNLKYHKADLENWTRVSDDLQNRFLIDQWNSKQWFAKGEGRTTYVVVHHNPSNPQRRLQNTIGAWTAMHSVYEELSSESQSIMQNLLRGYDVVEPAWKLLMSTVANLYDNSTSKFRWESTSSYCDDATAYALTLMFLMGIVPKTATLAFPIEEYTYEYIYDIDPELYSINLDSNSIRISVLKSGELEFIYGTSSVSYNFFSSGIYDITFSNDWNNIVNASKLQDLPNNREFLPVPITPKHDIAVVSINSSRYILKVNESVTVQVGVLNSGNVADTFNVTAKANSTIIDTITNITLTSGSSTSVFFIWSTVGFSKGNYTVSAYAWPVPEETNTSNNIIVDKGIVTLLSPGHDVAVDGVVSKTVAGGGYALTVQATTMNVGNYTETFNVTFCIDATEVAWQSVTLESGVSATVNFMWGVTGFVKGNYTARIYAKPVQEEADITDNTFYYWIIVTIAGDVNGDFEVEGKDIAFIAKAYDTKMGNPYWNPNLDVNGDFKVEGKDIAITSKNYGKKAP